MSTQTIQAAKVHADDIPLDQIDVGDPQLFQDGNFWPYFARLRREDPVHYCGKSAFGPYWSITKYKDIMQVDTNHAVFSSEGGISILDRPEEFRTPNFISMDPPKHDEQRKTVNPIVAPGNLARLEHLIRSRACAILDSLPVNETFDWVDRVSIELTTQMLATLFDFPQQDRRLLTYWSDAATAPIGPGGMFDTEEARLAELKNCLDYFTCLWNERVNAEPGSDLISMLAHSPATRNMGPKEFLGNLILLIVGGNDTTRNSITGGLLFLNENPDQYQKLRDDPGLITNMVSEIIRYQTPLAHMRRTALADAEIGGKLIKKGAKVVMWYISGNRDDEVIDNPNKFMIDRPRARQHLSFGFGIHRCVGNRLAELQLKILWEEALKRYPTIEVVGRPERVYSSFVHGYRSLPVRIPA
ncbi:MAG TPA: cytochrome P450 [Bradyrhizobium sp.]|jgi:cytochrome P450|uniref:cytochrome P450 n=1 Tax=Bradyrhizobium sp. TaxID=376 RepID=UPI002D0DE05F|nr:cytochrome P450 [Bradyrhizobium sp.]HTB02270.1 cytochrome P450 [Bradyrhizobium sp.]